MKNRTYKLNKEEGHINLPSEIINVIYNDDFIEFKCVCGTYRLSKPDSKNEQVYLSKVLPLGKYK